MYSDKYCPMEIDALTHNPAVSDWLRTMRLDNNILFYGGSGKKTRALCLLSKFYGAHEFMPKIYGESVGKSVDITYKSTTHHIEICPADYGGSNDKYVLSEFVGSLAETRNVLNPEEPRIFIIEKVDYLSTIALTILKGIMEKTAHNSLFILIARNAECIPMTIRNMCYNIRVAAPSKSDVIGILKDIAINEGMQQKDYTKGIEKIVGAAMQPYDLKTIINHMQLCFMTGKYVATDDCFDRKLVKICDIIAKSFEYKKFVDIRKLLYEIYISCVEPSYMIKFILKHFINIVKDPCKLVEKAAEEQSLMMNSNRDLLFVEGFIYEVLTQLYE